MPVFGSHFSVLFSVCDDCILKSTTAWLLKLSVLYINSFMHVHNTAFQIKRVFNNVLFSTEVHNPFHAHLLAQSYIYIYIYIIQYYSSTRKHPKFSVPCLAHTNITCTLLLCCALKLLLLLLIN